MCKYGMKYRGFSPFCQPMLGLKNVSEDPSGRYWNILEYDRRLAEEELQKYELEFISEEE